MDVIEPITPKASNDHCFIFVVIDYFTKWVEAASYASVIKSVVARFIKKEIICRYGLPERIISDNGLNLNNDMITEVYTPNFVRATVFIFFFFGGLRPIYDEFRIWASKLVRFYFL